jgi:5-methylcytosine-specific restriction endonuclease McrA
MKQAQHQCERCGRDDRPLETHHLHYRDEDDVSILYRESLSDLQVLCDECHRWTELLKIMKSRQPEIMMGEPDMDDWIHDPEEDDDIAA